MIKKILIFLFLAVIYYSQANAQDNRAYTPLGVGGGGAMSGVSISPYSNLWFVGTDMGTLFRSTDSGLSWSPVNHTQTTFGSDLSVASSLGFLADGKTVFHAVHGLNPQRSLDAGITFQSISMPLLKGETIKYWQSDRTNPLQIYCGTTKGLLLSLDKGLTWARIKETTIEAIGTYIDYASSVKTIYHASRLSIWISQDNGTSFKKFYVPRRLSIRQFAGGRDASGLTMAFLDNNGLNACQWARQYKADWAYSRIQETTDNCGYVWVNTNGQFLRTQQIGGDHLKMAENDASTIYVTGGKKWIRQYGTKVFVSRDKAQTWSLKLHQLDWDVVPYRPWPSSKNEESAISFYVGWWDDGYESFEVHKLNSAIAMGAGSLLLHLSTNYGENWRAPFTRSVKQTNQATREWQTRGIEVISAYKVKFHPKNSKLLYVASADIGGMVSENNGTTFRISKADHNSLYDFSFDLKNDQIAYAASGNLHDFPNEWRANYIQGAGGIYKTNNRGKSWDRLTPEKSEFDRQYLSVSYDSQKNIIYGGTQEKGIVVSRDGGKSWNYFNEGLPEGIKIIPQIEINPSNGNVYALLTGNAPYFTNHGLTGIYFLDVAHGSKKWTLLRGNLNRPTEAALTSKLWSYPTAFAMDFKATKGDLTLWLVDYENTPSWLATGIWKSSDTGKNWTRMMQMTHPTGIIVDPKNPNFVHASGYYTLDGTWGNGGQLYSRDGGKTWSKNKFPPLERNARNVTLDPNDSSKIIYSYFGGGVLRGPNPAR